MDICLKNGLQSAKYYQHYYPEQWIEGRVKVQGGVAYEYYTLLANFITRRPGFPANKQFPASEKQGILINPYI